MKFDLKTPCKDCPFLEPRKFPLSKERKREIAEGLLAGHTFSCHKTVDYNDDAWEDEDDDAPALRSAASDEQHCAGAMIMLERINRPNQMMRWMERFGGYDRTQLRMDAPVFPNFKAFIDAKGD
jgi:hypothetical protein